MTVPTLLAHLTDTHVLEFGAAVSTPVDNNGRLQEAVARIGAETPAVNAVIATGDLTADGTPAQYDALAELVAPLSAPVLPIPGNHDDRGLLRAVFADTPWVDADHASWVAPVGGARVVGLDTTDPGRPGAAFDAEREVWLGSVLVEPHDGATVLAMHHPPFLTGIGWMDRSGFIGLERFAAVLSEHPVDRVIAGHLHRPIISTVSGVTANVGLSTVEHVELDLAADAGVSMILDPVGYQVLRIADRDIVTHTRYIATGQKSFRPEWASQYE